MTTRQSRVEPLLWLLFSGGGMVVALSLPVLAFLFGVAIPLGWVAEPDLVGLAGNPLVRFVVFGICAVGFLHAAHRLRFVIQHGLRLHKGHELLADTCYGLALAAVVISGFILF